MKLNKKLGPQNRYIETKDLPVKINSRLIFLGKIFDSVSIEPDYKKNRGELQVLTSDGLYTDDDTEKLYVTDGMVRIVPASDDDKDGIYVSRSSYVIIVREAISDIQ